MDNLIDMIRKKLDWMEIHPERMASDLQEIRLILNAMEELQRFNSRNLAHCHEEEYLRSESRIDDL